MKTPALFACPRCGAPLAISTSDLAPTFNGAVACEEECIFPVLGGVPILLVDSEGYLGRHRESILATLAEYGRLGKETFATLQEHGDFGEEITPFADDWTTAESAGESLPRKGQSAAPLDAIYAPLRGARGATVANAITYRIEMTVVAHADSGAPKSKQGAFCILGAGAGLGAKQWLPADVTSPYVVDLSLRGALLAANSLGRGLPIVADVEDLPFADNALATVVAENVLDLVGDPARACRSLSRCLREGGLALVSSPDPALGGDDDNALAELLTEAGLPIFACDDGIVWPRVHSARRAEIYVVQLLICRKEAP